MPTYPRKKDHIHRVSPLVRVLEKGFYYLVAIDEDGRTRHFRMDRMTRVVISREENTEINEPKWKYKNWDDYTNSSFGLGLTNPYDSSETSPYKYKRIGENYHSNGINNRMYTVHLRLTRDLVGIVMDRFGTTVNITPEDKGHFIAVVNVYYNALFVSWILSLGNKVKILQPEQLADDISYYSQATGRWHKRVKGD